jgi:hypothetical protein
VDDHAVSTKIHAGEVVIEYDVLAELVHAGWRRLTFGITTRSPRKRHPAPRIRCKRQPGSINDGHSAPCSAT